MSGKVRLPAGISLDLSNEALAEGLVFWAQTDHETFDLALDELTAAFKMSKETAIAEQSFVYVVGNDDLLGRNGPIPAMIAAGLVSAARTAALEGSRKGWTSNTLAYDDGADPSTVIAHASRLIEDGSVTGELIHIGPGHIGKALA